MSECPICHKPIGLNEEVRIVKKNTIMELPKKLFMFSLIAYPYQEEFTVHKKCVEGD